MSFVIGSSDVGAVLFSFSGVALDLRIVQFWHVASAGLVSGFTRPAVLTIILNNFGSLIELVTYWWDLFAFNPDV